MLSDTNGMEWDVNRDWVEFGNELRLCTWFYVFDDATRAMKTNR